MCGIGDPLLFAEPPRADWHAVGEGWDACLNGDVQPDGLLRSQRTYDLQSVMDLESRTWLAPVILTVGGDRAFRVAYGVDWLPALTIGQQRALAIAQEARTALLADGGEVSEAMVCQWAAELLSLTHYIVPAVFARFALMDSVLAVGTLAVATALPLKREVTA